MSSVILTGETSGTLTLSAPLVAGSNTVTLPAATGTISLLTQGTAVASTSGTSIDFTGIPSWAKRITVMFSGVSTNGTSTKIIQIGAGSFTTSGYVSSATGGGVGITTVSSTAGFILENAAVAADTINITCVITNVTGNTWLSSSSGSTTAPAFRVGNGTIALGGTLDRVRITTTNGTDAFDAGSINIMYEG
jgi:hypothetical protein